MATLARVRDTSSLADPARRSSRSAIHLMTTIRFSEMETPVGVLRLRGTENGLTGIYMEEHRHGPETGEHLGWQRDDALFADARAQLTEYFAGRRTVFEF